MSYPPPYPPSGGGQYPPVSYPPHQDPWVPPPGGGGAMPMPGGGMPMPGGDMPMFGGGMPMSGGGMPMPEGGMPMPGGGIPMSGGGMPMAGGGLPGPPYNTYPPTQMGPSTGYPPQAMANYPPTAGPSYPPPPTQSYPSATQPYPSPPYSTEQSYPSPPYSAEQPYPSTPGTYPTSPPSTGSGYSVPQAKPAKASVEQTQKQMAAMSVSKVTTQGTVKPSANFNAETDATTLYNAMKGLGTDEKAIILVLTRRSNQQRQQIKVKFKVKYGKDLIKELKSELSGNFRDVIIGLMMSNSEFDAYCLNKAMDGPGTDESALIEIMCSRSKEELQLVKECYKKEYKQDLEKHVRSETSGHFRRLLVSLLTAARDPDSIADRGKARQDAQALYQAGEGKWGTDESTFNTILCARSYAHLRMVFDEYSKICKYDIEQSISREMSGDLKVAMTAIVKCVRDLPTYFAERLYKSMKGLGTDDTTLIRVMVSRCEVDMVEIKTTFEKNYRKSLESFIKGDTSGDYKRVLLALAGEY